MFIVLCANITLKLFKVKHDHMKVKLRELGTTKFNIIYHFSLFDLIFFADHFWLFQIRSHFGLLIITVSHSYDCAKPKRFSGEPCCTQTCPPADWKHDGTFCLSKIQRIRSFAHLPTRTLIALRTLKRLIND